MTSFLAAVHGYRSHISKRNQKKRLAKREQLQEIETQKFLTEITTFHLRQYPQIDWNNIICEIAPLKPKLDKHHELMLNKKWEQFEFGVFQRLIGIEALARTTFGLFITEAKSLDDQQYQEELQGYRRELEEWEKGLKIAMGIQKKDPTMYQKALEYLLAFQDITEAGFRIDMTNLNSTNIFFDVSLPSQEFIYKTCFPNTSRTEKSAEENALFERCVASAIVSILIDAFAILPVEKVTINIQYDKPFSISKTIICATENIQKYNALEEKPLDFLHSL